eukprot:jgi/Ulvmu1/3227/UM015_0268.1
MSSATVAIVGSGVSGSVCAHALKKASRHVAVTLFDMSTRGPGGRAATRLQGGYQFDHGCSFIAPPRDAQAAQLISELANTGIVRPWDVPIRKFDISRNSMTDVDANEDGFCGFFRSPGAGSLLVGTPSMAAVSHHLATESGADQRWGTRVTGAQWSPDSKQWKLSGMVGVHKDSSHTAGVEELGKFDSLVIADAATVRTGSAGHIALDAPSPGLQHVLGQMSMIRHDPTFAVMLTFPRSLGLNFAACQIENHPSVMFVSCDSSKPGRARSDGQECWVALAAPEFARSLLANRPVSVDGKYNPQTQEYLQSLLPTMLKEVMGLLPVLGAAHVPDPCFAAMQRWGAGFVANPVGVPFLSSTDESFVACGDFCLGSMYENALVSGIMAAAHVHETVAVTHATSSRL